MTLRELLGLHKIAPNEVLDAPVGEGTTASGISTSVRIDSDYFRAEFSVPWYGVAR